MVGALVALSESIAGIDLNNLDVYVGVSSGGFVAAALANGISRRRYRLFIDDGADASLSPASCGRRSASCPAPCRFRACFWAPRWPVLETPTDAYDGIGWRTQCRVEPRHSTGLFDQRALDRFWLAFFRPRRSNDFRKLEHQLFVIATNLDTGASTTFGGPGFDHVPITRAIVASAALPGLSPPVDIDGAHYVDGALNKTLHASLALDAGARLVLCVNPLVPFDASLMQGHDRLAKLAHGGLPMVLAQTFRAIIHSRMETGMDRYRAQYPDADVLLFEPDREDADMFFASIFSYARRKDLCEAAYRKTRQSLFSRRATLEPLLAKHGMHRSSTAVDSERRIRAALIDTSAQGAQSRRASVRAICRHTLDQLEAWIVAAR
jgi:predicted acylesterase/phospholipase RssA